MDEAEPERGLRTGGLRTGGLEIGGLDRVSGENTDSVLTRPATLPEIRDFSDPSGHSHLHEPPVIDGPDLISVGDLNTTHPFKVTTTDEGTWSIETEGSSITNDDDLSAITITDLANSETNLGFVYIQCVIDTGVPDGTATVVVSGTELDEVVRTGADQTQANLLIAEVRQNPDPDSDTLEIAQTLFTATLLTRTFDSGDLVWTFIAYPSHPDSLTVGE